jgi:hypothetical protein
MPIILPDGAAMKSAAKNVAKDAAKEAAKAAAASAAKSMAKQTAQSLVKNAAQNVNNSSAKPAAPNGAKSFISSENTPAAHDQNATAPAPKQKKGGVGGFFHHVFGHKNKDKNKTANDGVEQAATRVKE